MRDRGQLYTLEGVAAGLVILLGLFFALQAVTATPSAAGSLNPHAEQQDRATAQGVLNAMDDSTLREAVLYWDDSDGFHCTPSEEHHYPGYTATPCSSPDSGTPPNEFGLLLQDRLGDSYNFNVRVTYQEPGGGFGEQLMVFQGQPGTGAVRASTSVTLMNDDELVLEDGTSSGTDVESSGFYAENVGSNELYNVLYVEVVVWRA